jgi:hypothetical protein
MHACAVKLCKIADRTCRIDGYDIPDLSCTGTADEAVSCYPKTLCRLNWSLLDKIPRTRFLYVGISVCAARNCHQYLTPTLLKKFCRTLHCIFSASSACLQLLKSRLDHGQQHRSRRTTRITARTTTDFREPGLDMSTAEVCKTSWARKSYLLWCMMHCYDPTHKHTETGFCGSTPRGGSRFRANRRSLSIFRSGDLGPSMCDACDYIPVGG